MGIKVYGLLSQSGKVVNCAILVRSIIVCSLIGSGFSAARADEQRPPVSVGVGAYRSLRDEEIGEPLRDHIHRLNHGILDSIRKRASSAVFDLFVPEVQQQEGFRRTFETFAGQSSNLLPDREFKVFHEYSVTLTKVGSYSPVIPSDFPTSEAGFFMSLPGMSEHIFVSLLQTEGAFKDLLFSFVYVKHEDRWRLYHLHLGEFRVAGKAALEWCQDAKRLFEKGYLVPAALRMQVAGSCIRPAPFIQYAEEKKVKALDKKIQEALNARYEFPIVISDVATKPAIYFVRPQFVKGELFPLVGCESKVAATDPSALKEEARAMLPNVVTLFPGIADGVSHVVFSAFFEPPTDPTKPYRSYGTVVAVSPAQNEE